MRRSFSPVHVYPARKFEISYAPPAYYYPVKLRRSAVVYFSPFSLTVPAFIFARIVFPNNDGCARVFRRQHRTYTVSGARPPVLYANMDTRYSRRHNRNAVFSLYACRFCRRRVEHLSAVRKRRGAPPDENHSGGVQTKRPNKQSISKFPFNRAVTRIRLFDDDPGQGWEGAYIDALGRIDRILGVYIFILFSIVLFIFAVRKTPSRSRQ